MRFRPRYIRDRLTLWYVGIFGAVLGIYICGASILQYWQLNDQLHHAEIQDLETVEGPSLLHPGWASLTARGLPQPSSVAPTARALHGSTEPGRPSALAQ